MALLEPQQPTDWVSSLEKIYARQTRQTEEHYARLTARDKQELEKKKKESFPAQLQALAEFSTKVGKAKTAIDKAAEKKKAGKLLADQVEFRKNNPDLKLTEKYLDNYNALEKDQVDLSKEIKEAIKNKKISPELGYAILEGHGSKVLKYSKLMAYEKLNRSISDLNTKLNDPANEKFQKEFRSYQLAGNTKAFYEKYIYGELSELGLKDSWIKDNIQKTIEDYANTKGVLNSINIKDVHLTAKTVELDDDITTALGLASPASEIAKIISNQRETEGYDQTVLRLIRLADAGKLELGEWEEIKNHLAKHRGGRKLTEEMKKADSLLPPEEQQYARFEVGEKVDKLDLLIKTNDKELIRNAIAARNKKQINKIIASHEVEMEAVLAAAPGTYDDNHINTVIARAENAMIGDDNQTLKRLKKFNNNSEVSDFSDYLDNKNVTGSKAGSLFTRKNEIENISNSLIRKPLLDQLQGEVDYYTSVGIPTTFDGQVNDVLDHLRKNNDELSLDKTDSLSLTVKSMATEMALKRNYFHALARKLNPDLDPFAQANIADQSWKKWLKENGDGVANNRTNRRNGTVGRFSFDQNSGKYELYDTHLSNKAKQSQLLQQDELKNNDNFTVNNIKQWRSKINDSRRDIDTLTSGSWLNTLLDTNKSILDPADIVRAVRNPDKVNLYSTELIIKARILGIQPGVLLKRQYNALISSTDEKDQELVKTTGLTKYKSMIEGQAKKEIDFRKQIEKSGHKDLLYLYEHIGLENASPAQLDRFIQSLDQDFVSSREIVEQGIEDTSQPLEGEKSEVGVSPEIIEQGNLINKERLEIISKESNYANNTITEMRKRGFIVIGEGGDMELVSPEELDRRKRNRLINQYGSLPTPQV